MCLSDLGGNELQPYFIRLLEALFRIETVNAIAYHSNDANSNPELTAKLFECASHLLK